MIPVTGEAIPSTRNGAIAELLQRHERDLGWLARKLDGKWSHSHLYRVSTGERPLTRKLGEALAGVFNVPVSTFVALEDLLPAAPAATKEHE